MRIFFVASECVPFAKTGGLADVLGALPKSIRGFGHEVIVMMPKYRGVNADKLVLPSLTIPMGNDLKFCSIYEFQGPTDVRYFFVDCPEYYDREALYRVAQKDYADNAERFAFLSCAAIEFAKRAPSPPDIIHSHDWQTALISVYLKTRYRSDNFFRNTKTLVTIHNLAYQGVFPRTILSRICLPEWLFSVEHMEFYGNVNFLKGGILFADKLSTVSQKYSQEILTPEFGCGLEGVLSKRAKDLVGILNGVDYTEWNPSTDRWLPANYSIYNLAGKRVCKEQLLKEFGLRDSVNRPLIGIVSRLADQKGFDLLHEVGDSIVKEGASLVVLGTGEEKYSRFFLGLEQKYPLFVGAKIRYDDRLAHLIEGGADIFLMPSRFEPCGLNQIYSLKYGTVPVVRATGGLDDTIIDFSSSPKGNGFKFAAYTSEELLQAIRRALQAFEQPTRWQRLISNCMRMDFSWTRSAQRYLDLYRSLLAN